MDAFEQLAADIFWNEGNWVRTSVKVELTREEKIRIGKHSTPRWEIDLIAYRARPTSSWRSNARATWTQAVSMQLISGLLISLPAATSCFMMNSCATPCSSGCAFNASSGYYRPMPIGAVASIWRSVMMRIFPMFLGSSRLAALMILLLPCAPTEAHSILFVGNSFTFGAGSPVRKYHPDQVTDLNGEGIGGVPALGCTSEARTHFLSSCCNLAWPAQGTI